MSINVLLNGRSGRPTEFKEKLNMKTAKKVAQTLVVIAIAVLLLGMAAVLVITNDQNNGSQKIFAGQTATALVPTASPTQTGTALIVTQQVTVVQTKVIIASATFTPSATSTLLPSPTNTPNVPATVTQAYIAGMTRGAPTSTLTPTPTFTFTPTVTPNVVLTETEAYKKGLTDGALTALPYTATLSPANVNATRDAQVAATVAAIGIGSPTPSATFTPSATYTPSPTTTAAPDSHFVVAGFVRITGDEHVYRLFIPEAIVANSDNVMIWFEGLGYGAIQINTQNCTGSVTFPWQPAEKETFIYPAPSNCALPADGWWKTFSLVMSSGRAMTLTQQP